MADEAEVKQKKPLSTVTIVILAVVLASIISGGVVGATMFLLADDGQQSAASGNAQDADTDDAAGEAAAAEEKADKGPPIYHRLDPKFVVSFNDQRTARFMQFSLQIMTRDKNVVDQIKEHDPAIRSNLLLLFNNKTSEFMSTREGKEQLLLEITENVNASLEQLAGTSGVEAAYFESFVIQ